MKIFPFAVALATSSFLCAAALNDDQRIAKGASSSSALLQKLGGEVKKNMEASGAVKTLEFCSMNALPMTDQVSKESGTKIQRLSLKNRNPLNAVVGEEKELLEKWEKMVKSGESLPPHTLKQLSETRSVYYKPILINNEACLKCHGDIAPESALGKALKTTYPEDKAVGYKMGDLRGMVKVEIAE